MRESKFRGNRPDIGWKYGYLTVIENAGSLKVETRIAIKPLDEKYITYGVDPESVGEYTGFHDRNGQEIYEGDIIKANGGGEDFFFEVGFEHGCFIGKVPWVDGKETCYPELKWYTGMKFIPVFDVVGNIYEHPDLLKAP